MTTLRNAPGGANLIESLTQAIKDLSLLYANTPDDKAQASLKAYVDNIQPELTEAVGAGTAAKILEAFRSAVMTEKHKIESGGASRA
jgi:hypothetical protein